LLPSQGYLADEEQQRENFIKTVLTHSKKESNNYRGGHLVEVHGFSFPLERLSPTKDS
jgi:hypothetical protein